MRQTTMKTTTALLALLFAAGLHAQQKRTPADYVNVFTGTSNSRWMLFPGATLPFGMVKLSPDNQNNVWNGGYEYTVSSISGFSHLHSMSLSGVSLMPVTGKLDLYPDFVKVFPGEPTVHSAGCGLPDIVRVSKKRLKEESRATTP